MTTPVIKNSLNAREFPKNYKKNYSPSKTIPDQTLSLRELLDRYARGIPIEGEKTPIYHGDEIEMPDLKTMDLSEIAELRERITADIKEQQEKLQMERYEVDKKEAEKNQRELFKKWKDEEEQQQKPVSKNKKGDQGTEPTL